MNILEEDVCRICLEKKDIVFCLRKPINGSSPYEKLATRTSLNLDLDWGPTSICAQCLIELDTTVNFLVKCEKANEVLSQLGMNDLDDDLVDDETPANIDFVLGGESGVCVDEEISIEGVLEDFEKEVRELPSPAPDLPLLELPPPPADSPAPRCERCGSLRRCDHWSPPDNFTCKHCNKVFRRKFNLKLHLKRHLGEREWPCPKCGTRQLTESHARRHCAPRRRRACMWPGCGKSYTTTTNLNTHLRTHYGERPFECNECGKTFSSKGALTDHLRIHTGVKPFMCPVCGRQFATNKVAAHMRVHTGRRPHACAAPGCGRAFATPGALRAHAKVHAPRPRLRPAARPHACQLCPAKYARRQSLSKHMHKHRHPAPAVVS